MGSKMKASSKKSSRTGSRHFIELPHSKGRSVDKIELTADGGYQGIVIHFEDNTDLEILIDPLLELKATLFDWKSGSQREIRRWPTVRSNIG